MQHPMYPIFVGIIKPNNFIFDFPAIVFFVSIIYIDHFFLSRLMPKMKDLSIATTNAPFFPSLCLFLRENSDEIVMAFLKFNLHVFKTDQQNLRIFSFNKNSYRSFYTFVIYIQLQKMNHFVFRNVINLIKKNVVKHLASPLAIVFIHMM